MPSRPFSVRCPKRTHPPISTQSPMKLHLVRKLSFAAAGLAVLTAAASAQDSDGNVVIKAGKVITNTGEVIEQGTILIENGRVKAVGKDLQVPLLYPVAEFPELTAFPGWVEAITNRGMDRANENIDVAAFLDVRDSIDPVNFFYEDAVRAGITTLNVQHGSSCVIGARGYVVKPMGMTVEQMTVKPRAGIVLSASPKSGKSHATQAQALRRAFDDLRRYLSGVVREKKEGKDLARREALYQGREPVKGENPDKGKAFQSSATWKVEGLELVPRWELDEKQAPLLDLVEGRIPAFIYCDSPMDVRIGIEIARDNGFLAQSTFVLGSACWKAADELKAAGRPVILSPALTHVERDPVTGKEIETFVPRVFHEKGVPFALRSLDSSSQSLWFQVARCIGFGLDRQVAIDAATRTPAELLGLSARVGTLEAGKDGNVVLYSGDPLSVTSKVEYVFIEGRKAYDRSKDVRIKHLFEGKQPENTSPSEMDLSEQGGDTGTGSR
jgi:imidazolonepropionase-like amidohydrolase